MTTERAPLTLRHRMAYALGAAGFVIPDRLLMTWAFFFYAPPAGEGLSDRLPEWSLFGIITVWGLVSVLGRVVDGVVDPVVASWTDRSRHPFGRRRIFLAAGVLPLALCTAAVFFPPFEGRSWGNAAYVGLALAFFFAAFTVYTAPFQALLPDLSRTERDRVGLSTVLAASNLAGAAIVMVGSPIVLGLMNKDAGGYQSMVVLFALLAGALMLGPIVGIPEPKLTRPLTTQPAPLLDSLKATLRTRGMWRYIIGIVTFWFGFNIVASGVPYFVTVLMEQPVEFSGAVLTATFAVTGVSFPIVQWLALKIGKGRMMVIGAVTMAACMALVPLITGPVSGVIIIALGGFPIAVLMGIPKAILASLAEEERRRTGDRREAMFYATEGFVLKLNLGISSAVLAALLALGKSVATPIGVQVLGPVTAVILVVSALAFRGVKDAQLDDEAVAAE
jgi:GPH family glycoside/pentoside/hexuronide:cation symporter